jgi:hypothetical protein
MSSILDLLNGPIGQTLIQGVAQKTNSAPDKTASVLTQAMPLILGAMQRNAKTPEGAASLNQALESPKHKGGDVLGMLGGIFGDGAGSPEELENEGAGILNHVLGNKQPQIESAISQSSGLDMQSVSQIIKIAAPIVMGYLSQQKEGSNTDSSSIAGLLGSVMGSSEGSTSSMITSLLDSDGDGSMVDDVAGMLLGGKKKKGGGGGLLGGLLG